MAPQFIRSIIPTVALTIISASVSVGQSTGSPEPSETPVASAWQAAQSVGAFKGKLFVVTFDQPTRRQSCRIQSVSPDKLICSHAIGGPRTYLPQQVVALILPGDGQLKIRLVLGINAILGAAIWGTVVLAPICPACAAATAFVSLALFSVAGAVLIGDDQPDRLLYLAPSQHLSGKLGFVEH